MSLFPCPECKKKISDTATSCPNCGHPFPEITNTPSVISEEPISGNNALGVGCVIVAVIIIFMCCGGGRSWANSTNTSSGSGSLGSSAKSREIVYNSDWDGSVRQVKSWLKSNAKDPKSLEYIEWSAVIETDNGFLVRVKYRAKNSFGGYVVSNQMFSLDSSGNVDGVVDY